MMLFDIRNLVEIIIFLLIILILYSIAFIRSFIRNKKLNQYRKIAIKIIDQFEELLSENNIKISNENRSGNEDKACIYGMQYYDLENTIVNILNERMI